MKAKYIHRKTEIFVLDEWKIYDVISLNAILMYS